jgi:hypothetical protein
VRARTRIALAALPLAFVAGTQGSGAKAPDVPAATPTGPARDCIPINQFRETRIRDDSTIDFIGIGRQQVWRVTLPNSCPSLRSENRFTYETSLSQLCNTDIIYVLEDWGGQLHRGAGCGMGQFVPVALAK